MLLTLSFLMVSENPDPEVKILDLTIETPDRAELILPIPFEGGSKTPAFVLKDGSKYRLKFNITVANNIVSGLRYTNTVWKKNIRGNNCEHSLPLAISVPCLYLLLLIAIV